MRSLFTGFVVAVSTALIPMIALAGNQDVAAKIAASLHDSGQLKDYKVGVRFDNGTVWLEGNVASEQQMNTALKLVFLSQEVDRVVNRLETVPTARPIASAETPETLQLIPAALGPEQIRRTILASHVTPRTQETRSMASLQRVAGRSPSRPLALPTAPRRVAPQPQRVVRQQMIRQAPHRAAYPQAPGRPIPVAYMQPGPAAGVPGRPMPSYMASTGGGRATPARYDQPRMPNYAWPSYASHPNYAALTYPKQHSAAAWPYIGPFYPYPQVPLGWRKVSLEWDDGWWMLDFYDHHKCH